MLKGFFDDSGSDALSPFYILAGYVSTAERWGLFSEEWQAVLDADPKIKYFKMREAESLRKQFWGWSETDRDAKVERLAEVIKEYAAWEVSFILPRQIHDTLIATVPLPEKYKDPYLSCYNGLMAVLSAFRKLYGFGDEQIDVVFDEQGKVQGIVTPFHAEVRKIPGVGAFASGIAFHSDRDVLPIQAADFIAWHLRRYCSQGETRPGLLKVMSIPSLRMRPPAEILRYVFNEFMKAAKEG